MTYQRAQRVAEQIKHETAEIIRNELKDPRLGFVTVTTVEVSNDLRHVKIFISVLGDEQSKQQSMTALNNAAGFVRKELGQRVKLRYTPEVLFRLDASIEHGVKIQKLLNEMHGKEEF